MYHFRDEVGNPIRDESIEATATSHDRRASPLFIKIGRLPKSDLHYVVALSLWSAFLPSGEHMLIKAKKGNSYFNHQLTQPNKTAIDNFLNALEQPTK